MDDVIVRGLVKGRFDFDDHLPHHARQLLHFVLLDVLEMAGVVFRQNPRLEGEPAGEGTEGDEARRVQHDPLFGGQLLLDHVAVHAAAAIVVKLQRAGHFLPDVDRHDRRDDQLAVGVFQRGARRGATFLKIIP